MAGADDGIRRIGPDPFLLPASRRDLARRLRGRLVAPVTVWTAYDGQGNGAGITVSSVLVVEGAPPTLVGLIGPISEFWEAVTDTRRFMVHVLDSGHTRLADQFALRYPGDPFENVDVSVSEWGPVLEDVKTRAACVLDGYMEAGYFLLLRGDLISADLAAEPQPLVHYRGRYVTTAPRRR